MAAMKMLEHLISECLGNDRSVMEENYLAKCREGVSVWEVRFDPLIPGRTVLRYTLRH